MVKMTELKYPDVVDIGDMQGGSSYCYFMDDSSSTTEWWKLGTVVERDLGTIVAGHEPDSSWYWDSVPIFTLPNKNKVYLVVQYNPGSTGQASMVVKTGVKDKDGNEVALFSNSTNNIVHNNISNLNSGNINYLSSGCRVWVYLNIKYYPMTPQMASGQSPSRINLMIMGNRLMTATIWENGGTKSNWITGGLVYAKRDMIDLNPGATNTNFTNGALWEIKTNNGIERFEEWLHNTGDSFEGDGVNPGGGTPGSPAGSDDTSESGGGGGNYDDSSDPIDFPDLPTGGALECGAVIAHRVSQQTIEAIFSKLWSNSIFDPSTMWQKSLQNPMDAIVSLHALPFSPEVDGSTNIDIGNFNTELSSPEVTSQYLIVDCGTKNIKEYWGSALDYSPYTRAEVYLPFIGIKDIAVEDIMTSTVHIKYYIDVLTGECIAFIKCGLSVLYHFKGNCKMEVPLSASTMDLIQNTLGAMGHIVSSAAVGAAVGGGAGALAGTVISSAANVASTKIRTTKSDDMSGSSALMDDFVPYFILHRPIQSLAKDYNKFKGYPSNITSLLSSLQGYTEVEHINLQNIPNATEAEMVEIKNLLKQGVLL